MSKLNFNIEESYRYLSLNFLSCQWEFESHLSIEDLFKLQNLVDFTKTASDAEESKIKHSIFSDTDELVTTGKSIQYQKQLIEFIEEKIKEKKILLLNRIEDNNNHVIDQEFLEQNSFRDYKFFSGLYCQLGVHLCQWAERQSFDLKKK